MPSKKNRSKNKNGKKDWKNISFSQWVYNTQAHYFPRNFKLQTKTSVNSFLFKSYTGITDEYNMHGKIQETLTS
jgi:hypothetical protein